MDALHSKLGKLNFFDPACGCGNFLIIAYRELRRLEIELIKETNKTSQLELDAAVLSRIDVDQFHGIEIGEFPAEIARAAMWMMDHIMNNELSRAFGQNYARIPLKKSANVICADALEIDWEDVIRPNKCSFVLGNPPFSGFTLRNEEKRAQAKAMIKFGAEAGRLDYVAFWFLKAGDYCRRSDGNVPQIAFVATNSITQGEQVSALWPKMFDRYKFEIAFAHRTFEWGSDARGRAHVHCVIVGLTAQENSDTLKRLFSYEKVNSDPTETSHKWISPYLIDASQLSNRHAVVERCRTVPKGYPKAQVGTKPVDGGFFILNDDERKAALTAEPNLVNFIRPYIGATEFIEGKSRWLFCPNLMPLPALRASNFAKEKVRQVKEYRTSGGSLAQKLADTPTEFHVTVIPDAPFLILPETTSSRREYVPFGWGAPPVVPSNKLNIILDANEALLSLLSSKMHISWLANIGGRLKNDFSYSTGIVYNTFPWPTLNAQRSDILSKLGRKIIEVRQKHSDASLGDLYDPDFMPTELRKAHHENDLAVDRLFRKSPFRSERERVEYLFELYEKSKLANQP